MTQTATVRFHCSISFSFHGSYFQFYSSSFHAFTAMGKKLRNLKTNWKANTAIHALHRTYILIYWIYNLIDTAGLE